MTKEMALWSDKYLKIGKGSKPFIQSLKNDKELVLGDLMDLHIKNQ